MLKEPGHKNIVQSHRQRSPKCREGLGCKSRLDVDKLRSQAKGQRFHSGAI